MKYFVNCKTLEELKREYRRLAVANHPDHGGDVAIMQQIKRNMKELSKDSRPRIMRPRTTRTRSPKRRKSLSTLLIFFPALTD